MVSVTTVTVTAVTMTAVTMLLVAALLVGIIMVSPSSGLDVVLMQCRICEETSKCSSYAGNPFACQCDDECDTFDDCCSDSFVDSDEECDTTFSEDHDYRCKSLVSKATSTQLAAYTISKCPSGWIQDEGEGDREIRQVVSDKCNSMSFLPPVTDVDSRLVFNNEFCALCHDVRTPLLWSTLYFCSTEVTTVLSSTPLTTQVLTDLCTLSNFYPPPFHFRVRALPRFCTPSISTCLPSDELNTLLDYEELLNGCQEGSQNLVTISNTSDNQLIFRNEYCALCNGYTMETLECFNDMTHMYTTRSESQVSLLLDTVNKDAQLDSSRTKFILTVECEAGQVFNSNTNSCQGTVCNFITNEEPTENNGCFNFNITNKGRGILDITHPSSLFTYWSVGRYPSL